MVSAVLPEQGTAGKAIRGRVLHLALCGFLLRSSVHFGVLLSLARGVKLAEQWLNRPACGDLTMPRRVQGWYKVRYSPDMTVPICSMPLSECTLAACKPGVKRTGYVGEGDCSTQQYAQLLFILAAIYALCYVMFISGILVPGNVSKWTRMNFQDCCTLSSECRPLGDKQVAIGPMQCCPCAHGVMICGTPLLMLLGLLTVVVQDRTEFELMPDQGYGPVFWVSLLLALCMLFVAFSTSKAEQALQAGARRALPPRPPPRNVPGAGNRLMPASAPHGFNYYTPPSTKATTVQTAAQLATAVITPTTQVGRVRVVCGFAFVSISGWRMAINLAWSVSIAGKPYPSRWQELGGPAS